MHHIGDAISISLMSSQLYLVVTSNEANWIGKIIWLRFTLTQPGFHTPAGLQSAWTGYVNCKSKLISTKKGWREFGTLD